MDQWVEWSDPRSLEGHHELVLRDGEIASGIQPLETPRKGLVAVTTRTRLGVLVDRKPRGRSISHLLKVTCSLLLSCWQSLQELQGDG